MIFPKAQRYILRVKMKTERHRKAGCLNDNRRANTGYLVQDEHLGCLWYLRVSNTRHGA